MTRDSLPTSAYDGCMSTPAIWPDAEPISIDGGERAMLLCHGFTGSPQSLRDWAEDLGRRGWTVRCPRLPGHGTTWEDLEQTAWTDWYATLDNAMTELTAAGRSVDVAGLSMGGALALRLAELHDVRTVTLVNPAVSSFDPRFKVVGGLKRVMRSTAAIASDIKRPVTVDEKGEESYDRTPLAAVHQMTRLWAAVRADLGKVTAPLLYFRSREDHVVDNASLLTIFHGVASDDVTVRLCPNSYHVATMDHDAPMIFDESAAWLERH